MENKIVRNSVISAKEKICPYIRKTPLEFSPYLSKETGAEVFLKLENQQLTSSFKIRGAFNAALDYQKKGVTAFITASTGNHGSACACAAGELGMTCQVFMPENASPAKIEYLRLLGAEIILWGQDCLDAEAKALETAGAKNLPYLSPYNDPLVVAGQGTVGLEILEQIEEVDSIYVPVGGGGLMAGISGYVRETRPETELIAAQPENSCVMYHSVKEGRILDLPSSETIADGVAGGIEENSITFFTCKNNVDRFILLSEEEIYQAMKILIDKHFMLVEGSGALALAALLSDSSGVKGKKVVLVISGAKVTQDKLKIIVNR